MSTIPHEPDLSPAAPDVSVTAPLIWVLGGDKLGDNSQLLRAVAAMELPYQYKTIVLKPGAEQRRLAIRPSLEHVDIAASCRLEPPWPDLVVTVGRHLSCVALWVKQQSGGRARIALFNAPRGRQAAFDLILVPSLYEIEDGPNVLRYQFPLTALDPQSIKSADPQDLPTDAPLHVLLLGGPTRDLALDPAIALDILDTMRRGHARDGRIYVVTSRRTPAAVIAALETELRPGETLYRWKASDKANPYRALLASGATFTVTGDSLSMLIDVASLGKTLVIAPLPRPRSSLRWMEHQLAALSTALSSLLPGLPLPVAIKRNYFILHQLLVRQGYAVELGMPPVPPAAPFPDESQRIAEAMKRLLTDGA